MIDTLIDKQDTFEIVRDKIAQILANETASQQAMAVTAGEPDPDLWKLRVFTERANPWEQFLNNHDDRSPIVNVWYESSSFEERSSNIMERQTTHGTFNVDVFGMGLATETDAGHAPGDQDAAYVLQRGLRLVRNILMAATYTYLDLRGLVGKRWIDSLESFQPQFDNQAMQQVQAGRFSFRVSFNEFSPQVTPVELELVSVDIKRDLDGAVVAEADYDYTT